MKIQKLFLAALSSSLLLLSNSATNAMTPIQFSISKESSREWLRFLLDRRLQNLDWFKTFANASIFDSEDIRSASCHLVVIRPDEEDIPGTHRGELSLSPKDQAYIDEISATNEMQCDVETSSNTNSNSQPIHLVFTLKGSPIDRWGTRFDKLPFRIYGTRAKDLFDAFQYRWEKEGGSSSSMYDASFFCDRSFCSEDYFLLQKPKDPEPHLLAITCSRESDFTPEVIAKAQQIQKDWIAKNPTGDVEELRAVLSQYWNGIMGDKQGMEGIQDQINRGVRAGNLFECGFMNED